METVKLFAVLRTKDCAWVDRVQVGTRLPNVVRYKGRTFVRMYQNHPDTDLNGYYETDHQLPLPLELNNERPEDIGQNQMDDKISIVACAASS